MRPVTEKEYLRKSLECSKWESMAKARFAMRKEFEILLGLKDGDTYSEDNFNKALARVKSLKIAHKVLKLVAEEGVTAGKLKDLVHGALLDCKKAGVL